MNKRALVIGLVYSLCVIVFKLIILLGGYTTTKFGFYYSHILSVFLLIPFFFYTIYVVREKDFGGSIGGRDAMRMALTVMAVSLVALSIYNYIEFDWKFRDIAIEYYNGSEYLDILKAQQKRYPDKLKPEQFPTIISEQLSQLSAFKSTTGKLIPFLFIGLGGAFVAAMTLKRAAK